MSAAGVVRPGQRSPAGFTARRSSNRPRSARAPAQRAAGAVAIAALLAAKTEARGPTVVVSGANIDVAVHARLVAGAGAQATCTIPARDVLKPPPAGPNPAPGRAKLRSELN